MSNKITVSAIKADIGGWVGHTTVHPEVTRTCRAYLEKAKAKGVLIDFEIGNVGDDQHFLMTHTYGVDNREIHKLAWDAFIAGTETAKKLKLYGAGQDLLSDAFSGNVKGMGPGCAEFEIVERKSEPIIVFRADKCAPGAWNLPLYKMFADPFNTPGLVIDPAMHQGYAFVILDAITGKEITLNAPEDTYDILMFLGSPSKYVVNKVLRRSDGEVAAVASTQKLALIAGKYVGKDDPVMMVRCQAGFPAVGEVTEAFAFPHTVAGWMRGSHQGPMMPSSFETARCVRFDGPPRVVAAGFQLAGGKLVGPQDLFDNPAFDNTRKLANDIADYLRRHGPFEPHRLPHNEMEYTTFPQIMERLQDRFVTPGSNGKASKSSGTRKKVATPVGAAADDID